MRTVRFKQVLDGVATRMGLEPNANLQLNQAAALTEYINDRTKKAWEKAAWPEWTTSEQRQFRADWSAVTTYALGAEVYDASANAYYRSLQAGNLNHPRTDTAWWTPASDLDTYIAIAQSWETNEIGELWDVYLDDPRRCKNPRRVGWWLAPEGVWVAANGATKVYPEFSLLPPKFTSELWETTTPYVAGDLVYYEVTGECYEALESSTGTVPTNTSSWRLQSFPKILERYVKLAAIGDALREDENIQKALGWDVQALDALDDALERSVPAMRTAANYGLGQ